MSTPVSSLFFRTSFFQQLLVTFILGIIFQSLFSSFTISEFSYQIIREKLVAQGYQAIESFASQTTMALLYASRENAESPVQTALAFPDVEGVAIFTLNHTLLMNQGSSTIADSNEQSEWPNQVQMQQETEHAWYFVAPVFVHQTAETELAPFFTEAQKPELIGHVRLVMSKNNLIAIKHQIWYSNLAVSAVFAAIFMLFLYGVIQRLTSPLKYLADKIKQAQSGEKNVCATILGPKDIIDMENTFNGIMLALEICEQQRQNARDAALESAQINSAQINDELAVNISHELRPPLKTVLAMLELLQESGLTGKQTEYISVARNAGDTMQKLIEDILDFSRVEVGILKLQARDFVLHEMLDEIVGLFSGQAQRKGLELSYFIADNVPMALYGECSRIRHILINLVGNALKFTDSGSIQIQVNQVRTPNDKISLRFEVRDNGMDIPDTESGYVFMLSLRPSTPEP